MKTPDIIIETSRKLRKNMTLAEKELWNVIKNKKILWKVFYRQKPIFVYKEDFWLNRYVIPDFICVTEKLIIELDWSIHNIKEIYELDKFKEKLLLNLWYKILRFKNEEIFNNINEVLNKIKKSIN